MTEYEFTTNKEQALSLLSKYCSDGYIGNRPWGMYRLSLHTGGYWKICDPDDLCTMNKRVENLSTERVTFKVQVETLETAEKFIEHYLPNSQIRHTMPNNSTEVLGGNHADSVQAFAEQCLQKQVEAFQADYTDPWYKHNFHEACKLTCLAAIVAKGDKTAARYDSAYQVVSEKMKRG